MKNKKTIFITVLTAALITLVCAIFAHSMKVKIPAGYVGVVYSINGGIKNSILSQGWHIKSPWDKVTEYSVATEQAFLSKDAKEGSEGDDSFTITTSDGKTVNVDLEFSYHFDPEKLPVTFSKFKGQDGKIIERNYIKVHIKAWAAEAACKFSVMDIYGSKRSELNQAVYKHINERFKDSGIIIDTVNFSRIGIDDQTSKAIQNRINAQQQLEQEKIEKEKAQIEAEKKIVQAKGEAQSKAIKAQAEADANQKIQQSLSDELVEYKKIEKWDGKLPTVSGGQAIVDMRKDKE